jgi:citrate lyase subunit beta / citryl-CoA lyase
VSSAEPLHRSYLYAPGSSPRVMGKALDAGADAVILDLEDAVAPDAKAEAREITAEFLRAHVGTATATSPDVHVRINRAGAGYDLEDLVAVVLRGLTGVRLPKIETVAAIEEVARRLDELEADRGLVVGRVALYPTIESAIGAVAMTDLAGASPRIARFALGTADLLADLGASGDDDLATLHIRGELVLRSRAAGIGPPIDSVHTDLDDADGLSAQARRARALGFHGKSVIHPRQLPGVHEVFTPSDHELARARQLVAALEDAERDGRGAAQLGGAFVDAATVARARALLALRSRP